MKSNKVGYNAKAIYNNGIITIIKGSSIRKSIKSNFNRTKIVEKYRNNKDIVDCNMVLLTDISFNSPSTAAQFVADTSRNGLLYWRDINNKKLKDLLVEEKLNG